MNRLAPAIGNNRMWFGSYTRDGRLIKVQVWCYLNGGCIEFLTPADSLKANRVVRNPRVECFLGSKNGPAVRGTAEKIAEPAEVWRGYGNYWRTHPAAMLLIWPFIRDRVASGRQIMVRIHPDEPNPFHHHGPSRSTP